MRLKDLKKKMVTDAEAAIVFSCSVIVNDLTDNMVLSIPLNQIPPDGLPARELKILTTDNLLCMKIGQFNLVFIYDTSN